jgi:dTDP-4-dehydrorhamnose 3,5-epimerase
MTINETMLKGVYLIEPERFEDERGFFAELWTQIQLQERGLESLFVQCNVSYNRSKGTLRGLHYQVAPDAQAKLMRCTAGAIFDVGVDLDPTSRTYRQWVGVELSASNHRLLYLSGNFAHGYQTLTDDAEVLYMATAGYAPASERGVRWDDAAFRIEWPEAPERIMNKRDMEYPDFSV